MQKLANCSCVLSENNSTRNTNEKLFKIAAVLTFSIQFFGISIRFYMSTLIKFHVFICIFVAAIVLYDGWTTCRKHFLFPVNMKREDQLKIPASTKHLYIALIINLYK